MAELKDWNVAAASNNDTPPDGAPEAMAPSAVNDVIRENMAVLARYKADNDGSLDTTGSGNTYALAASGTYSAYARGDTFTFEANHTNTGAATLNVDSLGAVAVKLMDGSALASGEIRSGGVYTVVHDGTDFLLVNPTTNAGTRVKSISSTSFDATSDSGQRDDGPSLEVRNGDDTVGSFAQVVLASADTNQAIARIAAVRSGASDTESTVDVVFTAEENNTKREVGRMRADGAFKAGGEVYTLSGTTASLVSGSTEVLFSGENPSVYLVSAVGGSGNSDFRATYVCVFGKNSGDSVVVASLQNDNFSVEWSGTGQELRLKNSSATAETGGWKAIRLL